ncbi:hypothetical protein Q5H80_07250 [Vibrio sp. SNU_ST1]|uniref:hypothetical protein n=1 Tax=Vibrio sp. SNU_ST1 TaxID=3064001 RepID=UPI00272BF48A|nr:hypothetical protein [Vibrio sp. SNU_ST1]WKY56810.1 hypothetical protein Q5H80_07250 [Vibrio sp. SNU_ST1]
MPKNKANTFNTPSPEFKGFATVSLLVAFSLALSGCSAKNKATNTSPCAAQQNQAYIPTNVIYSSNSDGLYDGQRKRRPID